MKRNLLALLIISLGALLQQLLPISPLFGGMKPPILAAIALYYALRREPREIWLPLITAALLQDGLEMGSFGPALLAFPIAGMLANQIRKEVFIDGLVSQLYLGAAVGLFTTLVTLFIFTASGQRPFLPGPCAVRLLGSLALGLITLPLVSTSITWLESLIPKKKSYGWQ